MSHESPPLISVIVAVFNGNATLQQCIDSVARQTYPNKELIIIDGGSTDGTVDLLSRNNALISYWISEPDRGIYHAWNKALKQVRGEWICFLGADDYFRNENVLSDMATHLVRAYPPIRVVYGRMAIVNSAGDELYRVGRPWEDVRKRFPAVMCLPHPGLMHHRSLFADLGGFDESFRISGDYEFLLRELKQANALFIPDVVTVAMRQGGVSSNPSNTLASLREVRRAQRMHGFYLPRLPWLFAVARVWVRLALWKALGEAHARRVLDWGRQLAGKPRHWTRT
jgi:glycosyltransferase involved in cell wall biosynthesis